MWDLIVSVPDRCLSFYLGTISRVLGCGVGTKFNRNILELVLTITDLFEGLDILCDDFAKDLDCNNVCNCW